MVSYPGNPGRVTTAVIPLDGAGSVVREVRVLADEPGKTEAQSEYRVRNAGTFGPWLPVETVGEGDGTPVVGDAVQVRVYLLTDAAGAVSPALRRIEVVYRPSLPPVAPLGVRGEAIPEGVRLDWTHAGDEGVAGYLLYVGERPGRFLGANGVQSPLDVGPVGTFDVHGLSPDRAYVFAVRSYDRYGRESELSEPVEVRVGRIEE